jgi:hypothetical protein
MKELDVFQIIKYLKYKEGKEESLINKITRYMMC